MDKSKQSGASGSSPVFGAFGVVTAAQFVAGMGCIPLNKISGKKRLAILKDVIHRGGGIIDKLGVMKVRDVEGLFETRAIVGDGVEVTDRFVMISRSRFGPDPLNNDTKEPRRTRHVLLRLDGQLLLIEVIKKKDGFEDRDPPHRAKISILGDELFYEYDKTAELTKQILQGIVTQHHVQIKNTQQRLGDLYEYLAVFSEFCGRCGVPLIKSR